MKLPQLKITGTPPNCTITLDGQQLRVVSLDLHIDGESLPRLIVQPDVLGVDVYTEGGIEVDAETARTLIALGWTPPGGRPCA